MGSISSTYPFKLKRYLGTHLWFVPELVMSAKTDKYRTVHELPPDGHIDLCFIGREGPWMASKFLVLKWVQGLKSPESNEYWGMTICENMHS